MKQFFKVGPLLLFLFVVTGCGIQDAKEDSGPVIALSKSYDTYREWLLDADSSLQFVNLYELSEAEVTEKLKQVDGVVVTGGEDIHPQWYDRPEDTVLCNTINRRRDSLDISIIKTSADENIPLLGICRGMQAMNVALGGSLYADLPTQFSESTAHRNPPFEDTLHQITVNQASLLHLIAEAYEANVVSNHHQGVREIAPELRAVAFSDDELAEALEWKKPAGKNFFLGVQFHPERNEKGAIPPKLADYFIREVQRYARKKAENSSSN
ncbi:MAG: gamma-glutamyl-gamma-aminobutyrate hydrolase family protein [Bacteroidota bacterium]